jgi:hypothetical protein
LLCYPVSTVYHTRYGYDIFLGSEDGQKADLIMAPEFLGCADKMYLLPINTKSSFSSLSCG